MPANDTSTITKSEHPLQGVVLCSTSLPQDVRNDLAAAASEMGAAHKLDLTGDVTHLLVGDINTEKYRYVARERPDVCVLHPDWIEAVRVAWMAGGSVDVRGLEEKHRYPAFAGLRICVTGITDTDERNRVAETVQKNGAEYHGDLTKQVTHLIVAKPEGAKYTAMRNWGFPTVSVKWLQDSVRRQMALDHSLYDPTMPYEQQGKGAFREAMKRGNSLGKRSREESQSSLAVEAGKRKLRRTASRRLEGNSQGMWQDISAGEPKAASAEPDQWNSVGEDLELVARKELSREESQPRPSVQQSLPEAPSDRQPLFSGWYIVVEGFEKEKAKRLTGFLESNGAHIVRRIPDLEDASSNPFFKSRCICIPHARPTHEISLLDKAPLGTVFATEWWVERCIHYRRLLEPSEDILSQPLGDINIPALSKLTIATTGFTGVDYRQVALAIKQTSATLSETIVPSISLLVTGSASVRREKAFYAAKHGIPVVSAQWLWDSIRTRTKADVEKFRVELPATDQLGAFGEPSGGSPAPGEVMRLSESRVKRDATAPVRLSNTRKRHATPTLALKASRPLPTAAPAPKPSGPFIHEDDDDEVDEDGGVAVPTESFTAPIDVPTRQSRPLKEMSPNASPHKHHQQPDDEEWRLVKAPSQYHKQDVDTHDTTNPEKVPTSFTSDPPPPPAAEKPDYTASLASLLSSRRAAPRPTTASSDSNSNSTTHTKDAAQRLKYRPLGRAPSGSNLTSRSYSGGTDNGTTHLREIPECAEGGASEVDGGLADCPSTQLGYETPEAEAARVQMERRLGTVLSDDAQGVRLQRVGVVRDARNERLVGGGGGRSKGGRGRYGR